MTQVRKNFDEKVPNGYPLSAMPKRNLELELEESERKVAELKEQVRETNEANLRKEAERKAIAKKQQLTNKIINLLKEEGIDIENMSAPNQVTSKTVEPTEMEDSEEVNTSKGMLVKGAIFLGLIAFFALYQRLFGATMNDSAIRIFDAMEAHLWTHIALAIATILFGFGVMFLLFPKQFRYFHNHIPTDNSWNSDFDKPSFEGVVRMTTTFLTWVIPTWICASIMGLILG